MKQQLKTVSKEDFQVNTKLESIWKHNDQYPIRQRNLPTQTHNKSKVCYFDLYMQDGLYNPVRTELL